MKWRLLCLFLFAPFIGAQEQALSLQNDAEKATPLLIKNSLQVGFINLRKIMANAPQNDAIRNRLEQEFKETQKALLEEQAALSVLEQTLLNTENQNDAEQLERQILSKRRELTQKDIQYRDQYNVRRNEEMIKLQDLVMNEIIRLAKEEHYDIILNDTGVLYVHESADLTLKIIQSLAQKGDIKP